MVATVLAISLTPPRSPAPTIIILTLTPNLLDFSLYEQEVVAPEFFLLKPSVV